MSLRLVASYSGNLISTLKNRLRLRHAMAFCITIVVAASALVPLNPLTGNTTLDGRQFASLHEPVLYVLLGPLSSILDAFTLLSPAQAWTMLTTIVLLFAARKIIRERASGVSLLSVDSLRFVVRAAFITVAVLEIVLVAPRPMAALRLSDPQLIAVDFHSHTSASHDGRAGFTPEENREWHRESGFDAAYITDHRTYEGAIEAARQNPLTASGGTVLLPGIELRDGDEHVIVVGADPLRSYVPTADLRKAWFSSLGGAVGPTLILSIPGNDRAIPLTEFANSPRISAIEVSDGSPRGLAQTAGDQDVIRHLSSRLAIANVSGSDNHGWGRTAAAWSVIRLPNWRNDSPEKLDEDIRAALARAGGADIQVVMRRRVPPAMTTIGTVLSAVAVGSLVFRTADWPLRFSWVIWSWFIALVLPFPVRRITGEVETVISGFDPGAVRVPHLTEAS